MSVYNIDAHRLHIYFDIKYNIYFDIKYNMVQIADLHNQAWSWHLLMAMCSVSHIDML